jgi:hypothetical protein
VSQDSNSDGWKDEAYKAYVAKWQAHEAEESERRRQAGKIAIWLDRGPDDAKTFTREHQIELHEVVDGLRKQGVELETPFLAVDAVDAVGGYTGQLVISLAHIASPFLTAALVAWLKRPGRKVRVEFHPNGMLKTVEAQTDEQVLSIATALNQEARARLPKAAKE